MPLLSSDPLVSIAMPVYNGAPHFEAALASAVAQTYSNIEIIVVDDGSTDGGYAERLAASAGPKVRYFYQENQGVAGALNRAVQEMAGDIFCWLSHDDLYLPEKTRRQVDYFRRLGSPRALVFSDYDLIDDSGRVIRRISANKDLLRRSPMFALLTGSINGCTIFAPIDVMRQARPFDPQYRYAQDYRFWNDLLRRHEFLHQPECLIQYRIHPKQGSNKPEAIAEGDDVWTAMISDRTSIERAQMAGSDQRFYEFMAAHLSGSSYKYAHECAVQGAETAVNKAVVSVIIPADENTALVEAVVAELEADLSVRLDIVLAGPTALVAPFAHRRRLGFRIAQTNDQSLASALNAGLAAARGDYIAFIRAGSSKVDNLSLRGRLESCQQHGVVAGLAGMPVGSTLHARQLVGGSADKVALEQVMLHRCVIVGGFRFEDASLTLGDAVALAALGSHAPISGLG